MISDSRASMSNSAAMDSEVPESDIKSPIDRAIFRRCAVMWPPLNVAIRRPAR